MNFGIGYGVLIGIAARYAKIFTHPAQWKKRLGVPKSSENKDRARTIALELFPYLAEQLKRKKDVGVAEAVLIGYDYCRQLDGDGAGCMALTDGMIAAVPVGFTQELDL